MKKKVWGGGDEKKISREENENRKGKGKKLQKKNGEQGRINTSCWGHELNIFRGRSSAPTPLPACKK